MGIIGRAAMIFSSAIHTLHLQDGKGTACWNFSTCQTG